MKSCSCLGDAEALARGGTFARLLALAVIMRRRMACCHGLSGAACDFERHIGAMLQSIQGSFSASGQQSSELY